MDAELERRVRSFRADVETLLGTHLVAWRAGRDLAHGLGEVWEPNRWPGPDASDLLQKVERAAAPPRPSPWEAHDRMVREAAKRNDEAFLARLSKRPAPG
jgi:hypothetical protein